MSVGARNWSKCPDPSRNQQIAIFSKNSSETPQRRQSKKVAQHERGSDEPNHPRKLPGGAELRPKRFFVGWVPDRQNRSPTKETAPSPHPNGHILGPRDTWDPKQGSLGPHFARKQISSAGVQNGPQDRENPLFGVFAPFQAQNRAKFLPKVPQTPKKPVHRDFLEKIGRNHPTSAEQESCATRFR